LLTGIKARTAYLHCIKDGTNIDPCMGSGHILVYAFDVLIQIYESVGVSPRDAAKLILEKNIYGLDIDHRAYQLAYFSLMMKARQYNRRILDGSVQPQVYSPGGYPDGLELGSIIKVNELEPKPEIPKELTLFNLDYESTLNTWNFRRLLSQKYDVVVTNPPYLGSKRFSPKLYDYVIANYPDVKSDLSMVMFQHALADLSRKNGFIAFITTTSWLFLSSFEKLRKFVLSGYDFESLVDFGTELFEGKVGHNPIAAWVNRNSRTHKAMKSVRLVDYCYSRRDEKEPEFFNESNHHRAVPDEFDKIQGSPIAYWVSDKLLQAFEDGKPLVSVADPKQGIATADNNRFLRLWYEVSRIKIGFSYTRDEAKSSKLKWFPYNKGGEYRKWYGNNDYVVNWENDGTELRAFSGSVIRNPKYQMCEAISWSKISSGNIAFRYKPIGHLFDVAGTSVFANKEMLQYIHGFCNSLVALAIANVLSPTLNYEVGHIASFPIIEQRTEEVKSIVSQNINLSHADWDSFETSWDFKQHPLFSGERTVASAFGKWEREAKERFQTLKANEEELNRIFIDIYGLQDELTPEVEDKDVTVRRADLGREIRSLISYAVGCMFGRYSLDTEGPVYAGGDWDNSKYITFIPDKDNILPICDDEYFDDDIMGRFVDFVRVVYGAETLEENLKFIADALGKSGTPRDAIRAYFLNDFYKDHCKIYQKRPIYWLFDSGKKNGFKSLIYLHRYTPDLLAKLRTDYVHEQQERYRTQLSHIAATLSTATGSERARLLKQQNKLSEQLKEITAFEEKVHHLADQNIEIDLDDGVKKNYKIFADVLAKI
jgi:type II restriction/modification system DNA methylase subunit YeeA